VPYRLACCIRATHGIAPADMVVGSSVGSLRFLCWRSHARRNRGLGMIWRGLRRSDRGFFGRAGFSRRTKRIAGGSKNNLPDRNLEDARGPAAPYIERAERIARKSLRHFSGAHDRQPAAFNAIFARNLLLLHDATADERLRAEMIDALRRYGDWAWEDRRDSRDRFHLDPAASRCSTRAGSCRSSRCSRGIPLRTGGSRRLP